METDNKTKIKEFINEQITQLDFMANGYVFDNDNKKRPRRNIFNKIQGYLDNFIKGEKAYKWVNLVGLRGAGKTTILYQLYKENKQVDGYFLKLSMDEVVKTLNSSISEVLESFEEIVGYSLSNLDKPLFLFIDEVQYDNNWAIALKSVYDKSNNVFIFTTGSAALLMNINADIARRAIIEKIYPLSFTEFIKIKENRVEEKDLGEKIKNSLFFSNDGREVFDNIKKIEQKINKYYLNISKVDIENYFYWGTLPFMIALNNRSIVYNQVDKLLERVVYMDIAQLGNFSQETIHKIPSILYSIADMDAFNFSTLGEKFELSRPKVAEIFSTLEKTEIIHRIYPYASHFNQVTKKSSKYLFSSPAFREMYYRKIGNTISDEDARGKLLEDLVGMYLYKFVNKEMECSLTYDAAQGGADFILKTINKKIVFEVGVNKKDFRQVKKTMEKTKADYGIIISEKGNMLEYEDNMVKMPLKYFLPLNT